MLRPILKNQVYVARSGLVAGLKRRGGFGFIPRKTLSREHLFLKSLDFTGKTVYDIGGHIGFMTLFFARQVGETGRVVTFEPNPQNYQAILDHIQLNDFKNVQVIQIGLGRRQETLQFVVAGASAQGSVEASRQKQLLKQKGAKAFQIEIDTLDNQMALNNLPKPDFVKIDVEGLELDVLSGMAQTISQYRPEMHIELHGVQEEVVVKLLLAQGYNVDQIEEGINLTLQNLDRVRGHLYVHSLAQFGLR